VPKLVPFIFALSYACGGANKEFVLSKEAIDSI
jgi:hypothetical protein